MEALQLQPKSDARAPVTVVFGKSMCEDCYELGPGKARSLGGDMIGNVWRI